MVGQTISHYKITAKLGEGGMGVVYQAHDTKLDRPVALKFLAPHLIRDQQGRQRFEREAKAAARLDHPNICTVYEIDEFHGQVFIVMAFLEGRPLSERINEGPLKLPEVYTIAVQMAEGLSAAHEKGIIHRDIKPENAMLTAGSRGVVKLMDFGLAQFAGGSKLTREGTTLGTVNYMSPEQAEGIGTDHRTDIWSFGVVLYEMVAGQRPFRGDFDQAIVYSIVNEAPEPLSALRTGVPKEFERIVDKCTAKKPEQRYQSVEELLVDLRAVQSRSGVVRPAPRPVRLARRAVVGGVAATVAVLGALGAYTFFGRGPIDSLAVLPFVNEAGNPDTDYLSEGISESLITTLSRLPRLKVKPRDTVFRYQGQDKDAQQAGLDLGVRAVLKGRVVQRGDDLSISAELVDASDGNLLWRDQYNRKAADLLAIEREISAEIAAQLRLRLSGEEKRRWSTEATRNPEAYRLYLQGRYWWNRRTEEALKKSSEYFEQAIRQDPNYAQAWTGLADSFLNLGSQGALLPAEAFERSREAASRAVELDPELADPHATLGHLKTVHEWDWLGAEREFRRAIELNPESATAHHWYAFFLESVGRPMEALAAIRRARELEPLSPVLNSAVARFEYSARRYGQAVEEARKALEMDPAFFRSHLALGYSYALQRRSQEAKSEFEEALRLSKSGLMAVTIAGAGLGYVGERDRAQTLLAEVIEISRKRYVAPWMPGFIHAGMGEADLAFNYFERAVQERALPGWILRDPVLDGIRSDPRFQVLLQRMGLSP